MTVEYEMTPEDWVAFNLYHHRRSPTARRRYLWSWLFPAGVWLFVCTALWHLADRGRGTPLQTFLALLPLFVAAPIYLLWYPWAYRRNLRRIVAGMMSEGKNRRLFGRHRVTISPDGIAESGEFGQSTTTWQAVERVVPDGEYAYVYLNALAAIVIPRRAFANPAQFDEFVRTAGRYHEDAAA